MTAKITSRQENRISDLVRDAVRALGLSKDEAQEIIKAGGKMQEQFKPILQKLAMVDQRFGPAVKEFEFTVPADYNHDTQLNTFRKSIKKPSIYFFNDDLSDKNFAKATNKLLPGKKYRVRIFPILETVTSENCMTFLEKKGAVLVGVQGLTLLQDAKADEFPVGKWIVSFDEKDALWKNSDGCHKVPYVYHPLDDDWAFNLCSFRDVWYHPYCLVCFSDLC